MGFIDRLKKIKYYQLYRPTYFRKVWADKMLLTGQTPSPADTLHHTFEWIKASFDANGDGGSAAYYCMGRGWKGSYPETTGYLIPTLYEYAAWSGKAEWRTLARKAADWLLSIQAPVGGWQGLQVDVKCDLRVFNTGMILDGLVAAWREEKEDKYLESAERGVQWILSTLGEDGYFSDYNVVGGGAFDTLVCACMLMVVQHLPQEAQDRYIPEIRRALEAHLLLQNENGWFRNCNFHKRDFALLHHIGYTLDGLVICSDILGDRKYYEVARKTARKLLSQFEVNLSLPAFCSADWRPVVDQGTYSSMCLTGMSQTAIVFQKIADRDQDLRYRNAALKINEIVASIAHYTSGNRGMHYGIPGSWPIYGEYQPYQYVNWAAKYHAESVLLSLNACVPKAAAR